MKFLSSKSTGRRSQRCSTAAALLAFIAFAMKVTSADADPFPSPSDASSMTAEQVEFFEKEIRPVLAENCYSCHSGGAKKLKAGLRVDGREALLRGGDSGEAIVPGDPDASLLVESVRYEGYEMPPAGKLPADQIQAIERWVEMGAPWPADGSAAAGEDASDAADLGEPKFDLAARRDQHWCWQPIEPISPPDIGDVDWPEQPLDHFILAKLENAGLAPAADADRKTLLRRIYFDLIGLPPTIEQIRAFLDDDSPGALERLVDQLLDSPHFGERWGRHWLDLVRYAESRGHEFDNDAPNAFQYRDYVIRTLNQDVPYDQMIREHIAGDLLAEPRMSADGSFNESILGTGFWFLGEWVHSPVDVRKDEADRFDNMIDVMSKAFLGVTVSCARCHDHKFDAISTADYYSLSGFLQSSDYRQVRFESIEQNGRIAAQLAELDESFETQIQQRLQAAGITHPNAPPLDPSLASNVLVDFGAIADDEFMQDGYVFRSRPVRAGQPFLVDSETGPAIEIQTDDAAVSDRFWDGLESINQPGLQNRSALSRLPRSGRTLRTPTFELQSGRVACRVKGQGHVVACVDSHRLIAGPLHGEMVVQIKPGQKWVRLNLDRYVGHRLHLEFTPAKDASLVVMQVVQNASPELLRKLDQHQADYATRMQAFVESATAFVQDELQDLVTRWADRRSELRARVKHRSQLAMAMMDGSGEDDRILIRGNAGKPGEIEPRHFLTAISGDQPMSLSQGSGRLQLAEQIASTDNPLTSRVIVNRIWHHLMGRGIVPTTDDFGVLGQGPTHPELLDHLADQFIADGQSLKRMIRSIVLSRTYRMSSRRDDSAVQVDPKNQLWHHRPPKRLQGEVIRDALLALSGRLNPKLLGPPIPIHLTAFMDGRGRPGQSGPLDGKGRRSIYTAVRRNFLSPFMLTFDTPAPFSTMGRRNVSNVPAQALILMNDPLVAELATEWGERAFQMNETDDQRINWLYVSAFARKPTPKERQSIAAFLDVSQGQDTSTGKSLERITALAHALVNTKEFIFLR